MIGQLGQMQLVLKLFHQTSLLLFWIEFLSLFQTVELILFAIHNREVEKGLFVASLRDGEGHIFEFYIHLLRYDNLLGVALETLS